MASNHPILKFYSIQCNIDYRSRDLQTCVNVIIVIKFEGVLVNHWKVMAVLNFLQIRLWAMP